MNHTLPALPFEAHALEPYISAETLEYHHGKHHKAYVDKLNSLIPNTEFANMSLEEIILKADGPIFNNAAQIWNHTFYWNCLAAEGSKPSSKLSTAIDQYFGDFDKFKEKFNQTAIATFGSGWAWLVQNSDGSLEIVSTSNAQTPMTKKQTALLTCDVWEHAYYIDYRNRRPDYIEAFWKIVNWNFVAQNFKI